MRKLGRFFAAVGKKGIFFMTGGVVAFGISVYEHLSKSPLAAIAFTGITAIVFSFGTYFAWKDTDDKLEEEIAKNQKPEIRGEIVSLHCEPEKKKIRFFCLAKLVNCRNVPTTIKRYSLQLTINGTLYLMDGPGKDDFGQTFVPSVGVLTPISKSINSVSPLRHSIEVDGWITFQREGEIDELSEDRKQKAEALLIIDDALNGRHEIRQVIDIVVE